MAAHGCDAETIGKLCCEVLAFNAAVVRLHKRFGFLEEGRLVRQDSLESGHRMILELTKTQR